MINSVLIVSLNYFPEIIGIGKYNTELAQGLRKAGCNPIIITTFAHYPEFKGYRHYFYKKELIDQITVYRCPSLLFQKSSSVRRILTYLSFSLSIIPILLWLRISGLKKVIGIAPTIMAAIPIRVIFSQNCFRHLHIQDFEVDAAIQLNMLGTSSVIARRFERVMLRCFNSFSTISVSMRNELLKKISWSYATVIRNWSSNHFNMEQRILNEGSLGLPDQYVLYSGNLGEKQGLDLIIYAAEKMPEQNFVICGSGSYKSTLTELSNSRNLQNVQFLPLQPEAQFYELLRKASIHLVLSRPGLSSSVFPSKLTNILATGGAAIVSGDAESDLEHISKRYSCFEFIQTDDVNALVKKMTDLLGDSKQLGMLKSNAKKYADQYLDRDVEIAKFVTLLERS